MLDFLAGDLGELGNRALKIDGFGHNFAVEEHWVRRYLILLVYE